jgi:cyclopropane-fatty-acyl-phospholipid synthase
MSGAEKKIRGLLLKAGITPNGPHPFDPQVHNKKTYARILAGGSTGLGESYMEGWWDASDLAEFFSRALRARLDKEIVFDPEMIFYAVFARLFNSQNKSRSKEVAQRHYNLGNDLYEAMLDPRMTYSCGYFKDVKTLEEAQNAKLDLVCRKIGLKKGDRVLDIGGGWGSFAGYAAEKYGASVVAVTISEEQAKLGREKVKGLPVEIRLQDYRDISDGPYDHIVSIGMLEHVGYKNYRAYMQKAASLLKDEGLFLLHTIGSNKSYSVGDPWTHKYIFPNGMTPSIAQIGHSIEKLFVMEDWHNFGAYYDRTLVEWFKNFDAAWPRLKEKYDERFYRMWKYYLLSFAGAFRSRNLPLWQIVLSKKGIPGGYTSVR